MSGVTRFTIDRSKWLAGHEDLLNDRFGEGTVSCLCDDRGNKCCLGFYLNACGIKESKLTPYADAADYCTNEKTRPAAEWGWLLENPISPLRGLLRNSEHANKLINANDDFHEPYKGRPDSEREAEVKALFAEQGIKVEFIGNYPK